LSALLALPLAASAQQPAPAPEAPTAPAAPAPPAPAPVATDPSAPAPSADFARDHFRRGEAAYQKGNYQLAIEEWQTAYNADPRPRIQYNVYQAHERLGQLGQAAEALQRYLSTADPDDPYYADATARMASLQQRLQATGIRLVGGVDGASINVSGHDWGRLPRPDRIPVQPGNHRVIVRLDGYREFTSNVIVPAGQVVDVPIQLERVDGAALPIASGKTISTSDIDEPASPLPFYIASAALGAGAVGTLVWFLNRSSELDGCGTDRFHCTEESAVRGQKTIALVSTIGLGAGAVGLLVAAIIMGGGDERPAATADACVPTLTGATCRLSF
jgi:hypothetical protein